MTELEKRGNRVASIGTAVLFAVFIILSLCLKFKPKESFETIYIQLDSTPVVKNEPRQTTEKSDIIQKASESSQAPAPAPSPVKPEPKKDSSSEQKAVSKPASRPEPKKEPAPPKAKESPAPAQKTKPASPTPAKTATPVQATPEGPKIKKSMDELMAEMTAKKPSQENDHTQDYESDDWDAVPVATASSTPSSTGLSGSAASSKSADTSAASSSAENSPDRSQGASSSTSQALAGIKEVVNFARAGNTIGHTQITATSSSSAGEFSMKMSDGSARQLLNPKTPAIRISEENARLIDTTRNVSIEFIVNPDGTVPYGSIEIVPAAALPSPIQQEIRNQLMNWLFSKGGTNKAVFKYTLQVL